MIELTTAGKVLARMRSRNQVKDYIRRQGLKVSQFKACEISGWADVYLEEYPELIGPALVDARAMILKGVLGKRAQQSDHGYGKKSRSFRQLTLGNNQSLSSSFLTSVSNLGGSSVGTS